MLTSFNEKDRNTYDCILYPITGTISFPRVIFALISYNNCLSKVIINASTRTLII